MGSLDSFFPPPSSSAWSSPDREDQAKKKKASAAMILIRYRGTNLLMMEPTPTASPFRTKIEAAEPMIMSRSLKREVMATSSSWVLSPISAMNMVNKMVQNSATRGHLFSSGLRSGTVNNQTDLAERAEPAFVDQSMRKANHSRTISFFSANSNPARVKGYISNILQRRA